MILLLFYSAEIFAQRRYHHYWLQSGAVVYHCLQTVRRKSKNICNCVEDVILPLAFLNILVGYLSQSDDGQSLFAYLPYTSTSTVVCFSNELWSLIDYPFKGRNSMSNLSLHSYLAFSCTFTSLHLYWQMEAITFKLCFKC